jgi:hypothetical protein
MPALASAATWRTHPYTYSGYLYVDRPPAIFKARVNQSAFAYPLTELTFDGVTLGAFGDIIPGQTLLIGSSEGADDLGRVRVRKAAASDTLYIGESSRGIHDGELSPSNDSYLTVLDEHRQWGIAPRLDGEVMYKDFDIPYLDGGRNYGSRPGPIANGGPDRVGLVDGDDIVTFDFTAADSLAVSPGSSIDAYLWDVGDGSITVGADSDEEITATFPAGRRYVTLTVTDDNGDARTHYILTVALDPDDVTWCPITNFEIVEQRYTREGGALTVIINEDLAPTTYPDGCKVMYFEAEKYGDTAGSLAGPSTLEHIKFVGWHDTEYENPRATMQGIEKGVEFRCISNAEKMRRINLLPNEVTDDSTPANWREMHTFTPGRFMFYQLAWHSTVFETCPFIFDTLGSGYAGLSVSASTLWDQVAEIAESRGKKLTCDGRGILRVLPYSQTQDSGDRTATVIIALNGNDYSAFTFERDRHPRDYWIPGEGITVGNNNVDVYCRAPGLAPGQGAQRIDIGEQLVADQTELNARIGHEYARVNSPWLLTRLAMAQTGDAGIDPALLEWIEVTVDSTTNRRGRGLASIRILPTEVVIQHNVGVTGTITKEVEVIGEIETVGTPAVTIYPNTDEMDDLSLTPLPDWNFDLYIPPETVPGASGTDGFAVTSSPAMYVSTYDLIARNRTPGVASPSWEVLLTKSDFNSEDIYCVRLDAWDCKNRMYVTTFDGSAYVTVWEVTNLNMAVGAQVVTLLYTSLKQNLNGIHDLRCDINSEGSILLATGYMTGGTGAPGDIYLYKRPSYTGNWSEILAYNGSANGTTLCLATGYHSDKLAVAMNRDGDIRESEDLGDTWSNTYTSGAYWGFGCLAYAYGDITDEVLYGAWGRGADNVDFYRRNEDGVTWEHWPVPGTGIYENLWAKESLTVATFDKNYLAHLVRHSGNDQNQLVLSSDGGENWDNGNPYIPDVNGDTETLATAYNVLGGWPWDTDFYVMSGDDANGYTDLLMTYDGGATYDSLIGDWVAATGEAWVGVKTIDIVWVP